MNNRQHLLPEEVFEYDTEREQGRINISDEEINEKYRRGEIRIVTEQARYPLDSIPGMLESNKYILNPEYQRRKRWNNARKSRLIESFIMNVPIPPIFLYEIEYSIYEVMDGLQRLTAIGDFYNNQFKLEGLEYWRELEGRQYSELPEQVKRGIDRRYLSSIVLLEETAKSKEEADHLKRVVFERLNSGGEKLTAQETRNALYNGKFNKKCIKLAEYDKFRIMMQLPLEGELSNILSKTNDSSIDEFIEVNEYRLRPSRIELYRKMEDVELVLRFFAYRHLEQLRSPIDNFLDEYLKKANTWSDETINELAKVFYKTIDLIYDIFQEKAFFPPERKQVVKTPQKSVYDPLMQVFSRNLEYSESLLANKDEISSLRYKDNPILPEKPETHLFDGRYNNRKDVELRIQYFQKFIQQYTK